MIAPSIDNLIDLVDSKYTLVVLAAKRAREIVDDETNVTCTKSVKPVTIALYEVFEKKVSYERINPVTNKGDS